MNITSSLPDALFDQAEAEARDADITQRLNEVYESNPSNVDPTLDAVQVRLFGKESW